MSLAREIESLKKRANRVLMVETPPELGLHVYEEGGPTPRGLTRWDIALKVEQKRDYYPAGQPKLQDPSPEEENPLE